MKGVRKEWWGAIFGRFPVLSSVTQRLSRKMRGNVTMQKPSHEMVHSSKDEVSIYCAS